MKKIIISILPVLFLLVYGCSNNSGGNPTNPFNGSGGGGNGNGGGGNGTVTFQIQSQLGQNGDTEIDFNPSVSITLTEVDVSVPAQNFNQNLQGDGQTVFQANSWNTLQNFTGVQTGMQFTFEFKGKTSPGGQSFDVTTNYTIP